MTLQKRKTFKDYLIAFGPPIAWASFIFVLSSQETLPGFDISTTDFLFKKCAHMFVYAVLYFLFYVGLSKIQSKKNQQKVWLQAFIICLLYAISDELHQSTISGRHPTVRDVGYDMLGTSLVFLRKFRYI